MTKVVSSSSPVDGVPVGSANGDELPRNLNSGPEQILPLLYPRVQEALLAEGGVHVARYLSLKV